jgi:uncharacterized damage-inducible protein DinB
MRAPRHRRSLAEPSLRASPVQRDAAGPYLSGDAIDLGKIARPLWQLLMQWFNHQTHHRGQASVQLDELGVENDFSGLQDRID